MHEHWQWHLSHVLAELGSTQCQKQQSLGCCCRHTKPHAFEVARFSSKLHICARDCILSVFFCDDNMCFDSIRQGHMPSLLLLSRSRKLDFEATQMGDFLHFASCLGKASIIFIMKDTCPASCHNNPKFSQIDHHDCGWQLFLAINPSRLPRP